MSADDRPMLIEFGGYLARTPPLPLHTRNSARRDYRERRRVGDARRQAKHAVAAFVLWAVSAEARPTRKHAAWLASIHARSAA